MIGPARQASPQTRHTTTPPSRLSSTPPLKLKWQRRLSRRDHGNGSSIAAMEVFCTSNRKMQILLHPDSCDDFESPNVIDVLGWWLQQASGGKRATESSESMRLYHPDSCQPFQTFLKNDEGRFLGAILHNSNETHRPSSDWLTIPRRYGRSDRTSDLSAAFWAKSPAAPEPVAHKDDAAILRIGSKHRPNQKVRDSHVRRESEETIQKQSKILDEGDQLV
eukprot:768714-Hanusia_phi.AAC.4